ncbi:MAG: phenylalanine--tRNA ligase subunit beta [Solirubrobacterales bacterium]
MRLPWSWLHSYVDPGIDPAALAERLSMTGTEVERIGAVGAPDARGFVIGEVVSVEPHPDADRLRVCEVSVGTNEPKTIVCGAPNVAASQRVAVALPGAIMPGGQKLGRAKLRGIASEGMILSETEMELGADAEGIAVLETDLDPGTALGELVPISDPVLELEITPNRPDCLSVFGVAREVAAVTGRELAEPPWTTDAEANGEGSVDELASVQVLDPELCPRFTARAFTDVTIGPSPLWLKQRLVAAGQRPINNVVDISNYVMLLVGQPLHAYDLDKLPGGELIVRRAREGERMRTLDGVERTFDTETVLVCDREGPSGIGGVMGGEVSEVSPETTRVLLEAATWNGPNILATSGKLALRSEASSRFEKQLHPEIAIRAQRVASSLLVDLCGAKLVPGTIDVDAGAPIFAPLKLELRMERTHELLGMDLDAALAADYLRRLGFEVSGDDEVLEVSVPADRRLDVTREVDLIEEVARIHGIDEHLPATLPERGRGRGRLAPHQRLLRRVEDALADAGLSETIGWHFVDPAEAEDLRPEGWAARPIAVHNPLSIEQSVMRTTLLGGLLRAASHNLARGAGRVALFESGRVFRAEGGEGAAGSRGVLDGHFAGDRPTPARESHRIAALLCGPAGAPSWRSAGGPADFYDAKGLVELLCGVVGAEVRFEPLSEPFLHPGRSARILISGESAGWVGEIHPRLGPERAPAGMVGFELDAGALERAVAGERIYEDVTTYPAVREDIAVAVESELPAGRVVEVVRKAGGRLLRSAEIFDVYGGDQLGADQKSLAIRLTFRAADRTLTDAEVAERRERIVAALAQIGGQLRG